MFHKLLFKTMGVTAASYPIEVPEYYGKYLKF